VARLRHPKPLYTAERRIAQAVVDSLIDPDTGLLGVPLWRIGEAAGYRDAKRMAWMALHGRRRDGHEDFPGLLARRIFILVAKAPRLSPFADTPPNTYRVDLVAARNLGILPRPELDATDEFAQLGMGILPRSYPPESSALDSQDDQSRAGGGSYAQNANGHTCWCSPSSESSVGEVFQSQKPDPDAAMRRAADAGMAVNWTRKNREHLDAWLARYSQWQYMMVLVPYVVDRHHVGDGSALLMRLLADCVLPSLERRRRKVDARTDLRTTTRKRRRYARQLKEARQ
jgi:hypothetical protein